MSEQTKGMLISGINTLCYAAIVVVCCAVIAFSAALISFANIIQAI